MLEQYKELLKEFVSFKSVSTDVDFKVDISRTANWLQELFQQHGFTAKTYEGYGNPVVLASYVANPKFETCLIYGHYDVQTADGQSGWSSDPFVLAERNGRLFARGVVDNKGQLLIHLVTVFELLKQGQLNYNIIFLIEGDEETGAGKIDNFITDHRDKLKADFALLSDGEIGSFPTIEAGFRGGLNAALTIKTSDKDLHSGLYGTGAPSAAHELSKLLAQLYDEQHQIQIAGFYDDVDEVETEVLAANKKMSFDHDTYKEVSGAKELLTEPPYDFYTQTGLRPTIQVTGLACGYAGVGFRNSIPGSAMAKINFRLVKSQKPEKIVELFKQHLRKTLPSYVSFDLEVEGLHDCVKLSLDNEHAKRAVSCLQESHGQTPVFKYCGGAIPAVLHMSELLKVPVLSVSLGNEDCNMHGANENFDLEYIKKGLAFSRDFLEKDRS